ncbi:hypothetical protein D3C73_987990 [compost metagenome]
MVPIPEEHPFQPGQSAAAAVQLAVLIHYEQSDPVAKIQQFRGGWMMRTAVGIGAHLLQQLQLICNQTVRKRHSHSGKILMVAGAFDQQRFPVQEKPLLRVKADAADAKRSLIPVHLCTLYLQDGYGLIEMGSLRGP